MYFLSSLSLAAGSDICKVCRLGFGVIHREFLSLWKVKVFVEMDKVILRHQDWSVATVDMFSEDPEDDQSLENSCSGFSCHQSIDHLL